MGQEAWKEGQNGMKTKECVCVQETESCDMNVSTGEKVKENNA